MAPPSFASAAAGNGTLNSNHSTRDAASERLHRTNGATQTFRRPSGATNGLPSTTQPPGSIAQPPRYVPPFRTNGSGDSKRYTKEDMYAIFEQQQSKEGGLSDGLSAHLVGGWQPDIPNGSSASWGRNDSLRDAPPGPEMAWDREGTGEPLGLSDMDDDERELFATSVNTPIKPANKDGQQVNGGQGRKISISNGVTTPGAFGLPSPSVARGGGRRREASESYPFPQGVSSPGGHVDQRAPSPPAALLRRRTEQNLMKVDDKDGDEKGVSSPYGTVRRNPTGPLSAGFAPPSSPWSTGPGPQSAGFAPMGSFGSFGMGSNAAQQAASGTKAGVGLAGGRSESRFKSVLGKDSGEDGGGRTLEAKPSISGLARVNENDAWRAQERTEHGNDSLDEAEENLPTGSAALAADEDASPPHPRQGYQSFGTPSRQGAQGDIGFGAFGMTSDNTHGFGPGYAAREGFQQTPAHQRMGLQHAGGHEPMSPTDTNPYKSPDQHGGDRMGESNGHENSDVLNSHLPGLGQFGNDSAQQQLGGLGGLAGLPNLGRTHGQGPASDRSQTSSVGPQRVFSGGLSGLGQLGTLPGASAWPVSQGGLGTPGRQTSGLTNAFGGGIFSNPLADMQSSGLAGLGGFGPQGVPYGGSRMASMFPSQMQDQLRHSEGHHDREGSHDRPVQPFGGMGDLSRSAESPFANQGFNDNQTGKLQHDSADLHHQQSQQHLHEQSQQQALNQPLGSSASNQPPAPQQRTMVMPDRMRWIYRDPQGQTQGPWSGLEMHDWYKAGFFSPELLVKKYEDQDYEPLAQLIRRIGNSREPFLVPQIGIPHGSATQTGPNAWAGAIGGAAGVGGGSAAPGNAQPPFASSFPSFGTTLTAEQQNALERRKQEEQYLMARQKEHLAQAQIQQRMQLGGPHGGMGLPSQLHHHSSAHSLQSQPSFGSIQSPPNYQQSPSQGPTTGAPSAQGFFDNTFHRPAGSALGAVGAPSLGHIREEEIPGIMDRLSMTENRQQPGQFGAPGQPFAGQQQPPEQHEGKIQQMYEDRARLQQEQAERDGKQDANENEQAQATQARLEQFQQLQGQALQQSAKQARAQATAQHVQAVDESAATESSVGSPIAQARASHHQPQEPLSLTEQVQKAASAKQSPAPQQPGLPQPFPPAPSQSPLPAPAAQRAGRQSVADQLQSESRGPSQSPSVDTPSATVAPWAKEPAEAPKGPSLREIQEAEAKQAEQAEALAIAARRAAFQKEMEAQAQVVAPAPGIPMSATWGAPSPATPTGGAPAAWAKTAQKPSGSSASKTLAQIQKEEESRKRRNAAQAQQQAALANAMSVVSAPAGGKSYANLASKVNAQLPQISTGSSAWTTVGASGKVKTPAPVIPSVRTASSSTVPTVLPAVVASRRQPARSTTAGAAAVNAQDEFKKWAINDLRPDLAKGISVEEFVSSLMSLPPDNDIITEAVHAVSSTIDSRHFAEEFIRRKRLADKGLVDTAVPKSASPANGASGWSEVAKKTTGKETPKDDLSGFAVKQTKKRGGRK